MGEEVTFAELKELAGSIKEQFVDPYKNDIGALTKISSETKLQGSDPLTELEKLAKILKAYSTKLGIICEPSKLHGNYHAAYTELKNYADSLFYLLSLLPLFTREQGKLYASYLNEDVFTQVLGLLNGTEMLCDEICSSSKENEGDNKDRLISVGIIWASCDELCDIAKGGNYGLLSKRIALSCGLVDDVLEDIHGWLEDPQLEGADDFLGDDLDSIDELEDGVKKMGIDGDDEEMIEIVKKFLSEWQTKIKMIKLLLSSFSKSITLTTGKNIPNLGSKLDELNKLHKQVILHLDELVSDVFMSGAAFDEDEMGPSIADLNDTLAKMVHMIKEISKQDPKKSKWIDVWNNKYFE